MSVYACICDLHSSPYRLFNQVQLLAVAGMVAYLATYKTVTELGAIAAVYTKSSDILAARLEFDI